MPREDRSVFTNWFNKSKGRAWNSLFQARHLLPSFFFSLLMFFSFFSFVFVLVFPKKPHRFLHFISASFPPSLRHFTSPLALHPGLPACWDTNTHFQLLPAKCSRRRESRVTPCHPARLLSEETALTPGVAKITTIITSLGTTELGRVLDAHLW